MHASTRLHTEKFQGKGNTVVIMKCILHETKLQTEADSIEMVYKWHTSKITFVIRDLTIAAENAHGYEYGVWCQ